MDDTCTAENLHGVLNILGSYPIRKGVMTKAGVHGRVFLAHTLGARINKRGVKTDV